MRVLRVHLTFTPRDPLTFPPFAANTFRGALGKVLRRIAPPDIYTSIFDPKRSETTLSGYADPPRPFVIRAARLDSAHYEPGQSFTLEILTFDPAGPTAEWLPRVFGALAEEGIGPNRIRLDLTTAQQLPEVKIPLTAHNGPVSEITIQFLTPTELKQDGGILGEPHFDAVFARARDRVSALCSFYQGGSPEADYQILGTIARTIARTHTDILQHNTTRRSSRTGQTHRIGGFTGKATYTGDLAPFMAWLVAAEWTGVGRYTAWGNGRIQLMPLHKLS